MSAQECDTMQQVKKLISSVLISHPSRYIPIAEFENDYRELIGSTIPHVKLGFSTLKKFLLNIPDVLEIREKNGGMVIVPVVNNKVSHIKDLINKQKKPTSKKKMALSFIPSSVRNQKTIAQSFHKQKYYRSSQSDNRPTQDLKSGASKKNPVEKQSFRDQVSTRVMKKYEEARPDVTKCNPSSVKERLTAVVVEKKPMNGKSGDKVDYSRDVKNRLGSSKSLSTSKVAENYPPTNNNKAVIKKGTKQSQKENCTREVIKHSQRLMTGVTIKEEPCSDDSSVKIKVEIPDTYKEIKIHKTIEKNLESIYEKFKARKGSSTEKEKAKSKERGRSTKKKSESGSSSSDSSRSSSESSSSSGSKSSSSSSSGSSSRSSSSSSDSSSSRNRNRARTKQRSQSKPISTRKSAEKDKKDKIKEKENDVNKDKEKDGKSKTASVSDKKSDAKHRSRSRSRSSHRKKRHRSPTPRPTKIHIGRLTRTVNREHIYEIFGAYGVIKNVEFPKDHVHSHIGRGYAYVEYSNADEAEDAMKHMDGGQIDGQEITAAPVLIPKPRPYMPRRSPMPMRRPPMRRPPPHFRRRSPLRPPRRSPPRRRPRSRNSPAKRRKRSRSSSSSSR